MAGEWAQSVSREGESTVFPRKHEGLRLCLKLWLAIIRLAVACVTGAMREGSTGAGTKSAPTSSNLNSSRGCACAQPLIVCWSGAVQTGGLNSCRRPKRREGASQCSWANSPVANREPGLLLILFNRAIKSRGICRIYCAFKSRTSRQ